MHVLIKPCWIAWEQKFPCISIFGAFLGHKTYLFVSAMSKTPSRHTRQRSTATTPGSVASARSGRSARSTDTEQGVAWIIKVQLAQDIEDQYPLAAGGIKKLLKGAGQPLCAFLDKRNKAHGEPLFGKRGDELRKTIGDLIQRWKVKTYEQYDLDVLTKYQVERKIPKQATRKKKTSVSESSDASSLSSKEQEEEEEEYNPPPPPPPPLRKASSQASKPPRSASKKTPSKRSSKKSLVGQTITTTSPPTINTDLVTELSSSFSNFSIGSSKKMSSKNSRTPVVSLH